MAKGGRGGSGSSRGRTDRDYAIGAMVGEARGLSPAEMGFVLDTIENRRDTPGGYFSKSGSIRDITTARNPHNGKPQYSFWGDQNAKPARAAINGVPSAARTQAAKVYDDYYGNKNSAYRGLARGASTYQTPATNGKKAGAWQVAQAEKYGSIPSPGAKHIGVGDKFGRVMSQPEWDAYQSAATRAVDRNNWSPDYGSTRNNATIGKTGFGAIDIADGTMAPALGAGASMGGYGVGFGAPMDMTPPEPALTIGATPASWGGTEPAFAGAGGFNPGNFAGGVDANIDAGWSGNAVSEAANAQSDWGGGGGDGGGYSAAGGYDSPSESGPGPGMGGMGGDPGGYSAAGGYDSPSEHGPGPGGSLGGSSGGGWGNGNTGTGYDGGTVDSGGYSAAGGYDSPSESRGGPGMADALGAADAAAGAVADGGWGDPEGGSYY